MKLFLIDIQMTCGKVCKEEDQSIDILSILGQKSKR
jgi:hypothetical protein